ncbi:RiPP maturation radical SAM C-methyltransferase [Micromonospora sp. WMMD714]|uniref:RiPP maturation radical SAM C-methyltransferase n=1 Tax=Micromonospora sp. WMMD714 TaxID=3016097 RepID=UPI00249A41B3|nr:RiPP maturation radical SAM C-methyltransferase [Micromonospora sp. WMMD714]WFE62943.1 RiPP maturation radical SAM C-methyltransferase [Micromonospora sp. WMMD714]
MAMELLPLVAATPGASAHPEPEPPPARSLRVALVNMPWARVDAPSIQCGLLQSVVRAAGHRCDGHYLNLDFAAALGARTYDGLAGLPSERLHLIGEWLFSYAAFGEVLPESAYYQDFPEVEKQWAELTGRPLDELTALRREVIPGWLRECVRRIDWAGYDVVGFTSTFLQNTASLGLGRMLRAEHPDLVQVYGGANFDSVMGVEYAATLPWLDYVVTGEGDVAFPRLLAQLAAAEHPATARCRVPGVLAHSDAPSVPAPDVPGSGDPAPGGDPAPSGDLAPGGDPAPARDAPRTQDLDRLPFPDYADYFAALERLGRATILGDEPVKLPVEFARGCWWGQKHHCTFCGLNALGMGYRSKSPDRAMSELSALLSTYPTVHVEAVDNILDMSYLSSFCTALADRRWDIHVFFEVKANLTREQLAVLRRAGILTIQPGIESLSSHVLKLMRKGSTMLLNVRLLKWARYHGIRVAWNMLTGFPGETDEDYRRQVELIPLLHHLHPPDGCGRLWLERFSPYFTDPSFPISDVRPRSSYRHIYPDSLDHSRIAYFFDYTAEGTGSDEAFEALSAATRRWRRRWAQDRPSLIYQRLPGRLVLVDTRGAQPRRAVLSGWQAEAYELCGDRPHSADRVRAELTAAGHRVTTAEVGVLLDRCCRSGVMVSEDGHYLSLAIPENPGWW